jgi:Fur family peroxide stress response transcriptional regulator
MNSKAQLLNSFTTKCQENNLKVTPQRTAIYQELLGAHDHPSADAIHKRVRKKFPHISLDTVNRTVLAFADLGIVKVVEGYGRPKRFDPNIENHHHFQCIKCHKIIDFHNRGYDQLEVPRDMKSKLTVLNKKVVLEGLCAECKK